MIVFRTAEEFDLSKIVVGQELLQHILEEMNVGCDEECYHESIEVILSMYEMGCTTEDILAAAGTNVWQTVPHPLVETEQNIARLVGHSVDTKFGEVNIIDDKWMILLGDNGMETFYFVFKKVDLAEQKRILLDLLNVSGIKKAILAGDCHEVDMAWERYFNAYSN